MNDDLRELGKQIGNLIHYVESMAHRITSLQAEICELRQSIDRSPIRIRSSTERRPGMLVDAQKDAIIRIIKDYFKASDKSKRQYRVPECLLRSKLISLAYVRRRAKGISCFKRDYRGETLAVKETLKALVDGGVLITVTPMEARKYMDLPVSITSILYYTGPNFPA